MKTLIVLLIAALLVGCGTQPSKYRNRYEYIDVYGPTTLQPYTTPCGAYHRHTDSCSCHGYD